MVGHAHQRVEAVRLVGFLAAFGAGGAEDLVDEPVQDCVERGAGSWAAFGVEVPEPFGVDPPVQRPGGVDAPVGGFGARIGRRSDPGALLA